MALSTISLGLAPNWSGVDTGSDHVRPPSSDLCVGGRIVVGREEHQIVRVLGVDGDLRLAVVQARVAGHVLLEDLSAMAAWGVADRRGLGVRAAAAGTTRAAARLGPRSAVTRASSLALISVMGFAM